MEEIKFGLIAGFVMIGFLALWDFKLEDSVKKRLRKHLDKGSEETKCIFIDPRREI